MELKVRYKQTEIGLFPNEWDVELLPKKSWFQEGPGLRNWQFKNQGMKVINVTNLEDGFLNLNRTERYISLDEFKRTYAHFEIEVNDIVVASSGNSYGKVAVVRDQDLPLMMNTSVIRFKPLRGLDHAFLLSFLNSNLFKNQIDELITGGAQPNFGPAHLKQIWMPVPPALEQRLIAAALHDIDAQIAALDALITKKRNLKHGAMEQLLTGKKRLPGFTGEWQMKKLGEMLAYEQPGPYLTKSTEFSDIGSTPVLTANKSFILGYTDEMDSIYTNVPVIIFDDFMTASKYVTFPFKVRSSALKILRARDNSLNLRFIFEKMQLLDISIGEHKRHYISEYRHIEVDTPLRNEQDAIAAVLTDMDAEIKRLEQQRAKTGVLKQGMMQELLTGKTRLL